MSLLKIKYTNKIFLIILCISFLAILPSFLREVPLGHDPYYYLARAGEPTTDKPPLFFHFAIIEQHQPIMLLAAFLTFAFAYLLFNQLGAAAPMSTALLLSAPGLIFNLNKFENDILGIPFCIAALWLYTKGHKKTSLALLVATTLLIWQGALLFIAMCALNELSNHTKYWYLALPLLMLRFRPDTLVGEQMLGFIFIPAILLGLCWGFLSWKKTCRFNRVFASFFLYLGILNAKWLWLAAFPLAMMTTTYLQEKQKKYAIAIFLCCGLLFGGYWVTRSEPTPQHFEDLREMKEYTGTDLVSNSWHFGHWMTYAGMTPLNSELNPVTQMVPPPWTTQYALWHNTSDVLENYTLIKNYSWVGFYKRNNYFNNEAILE